MTVGQSVIYWLYGFGNIDARERIDIWTTEEII